ncbi:MAG TPA: c-type cytochrome [Vicinamibacterales bacterium]
MKFVSTAIILWAGALVSAGTPAGATAQRGGPPPAAGTGEALFAANCAFCHGRDATGGASGPDLTDSPLVNADVNGDKMLPVIRSGRPEKGMPPFAALPESDIRKIVEYVHARKTDVDTSPGRRRKVSAEDISTGSVASGRAYFDGNCATCHKPSGDLAGVASKYRGLALMQRMLYPTAGNAASPAEGGERRKPEAVSVTVTLASGQTVTGTLTYRDEFNVAFTDASGRPRSFSTSAVKVAVRDPLQAHADLLAKYTDADIHNLVAFLQTLK